MRRAAGLGAIALALLLAACAPRLLTRKWEPSPARAGSPARADGRAADASAETPDPRLKPLTGEGPAQIVSDRLDYVNAGRVSVFQGRVQVRQGAALLEAPYLEVRSEDGQAFARDGVRMIDHERGVTVTAQELEYRQTLSNARARGDVLLVSHDNQGEPLTMRSERLTWDNANRQARAEGAVQATYLGSTATAEAMTFDHFGQTIELADGNTPTARPRIEQDGNTITGDRIVLRLKDRTYEVTGRARADVTPRQPAASAAARKEQP